MYKKSKLFDKEGFYIVLFVCLCIVAVTAVYVSRNNTAKTDRLTAGTTKAGTGVKSTSTDPLLTLTGEAQKSLQTSKQPVKSITDVQQEKIQKSQSGKRTVHKAVADTGRKTAASSTRTTSAMVKPDKLAIILPVKGEIVKKYDNKELQYAKAMSQWETHEGIDIACDLGCEVNAVCEGKVVEVITKDDKLSQNTKNGFGARITIEHENGYRSIYSNLATESMKVKKGDLVKNGDVIGMVGDTSQREAISLEGSHLHFELVKKDGNQYVSVNPEEFMK